MVDNLLITFLAFPERMLTSVTVNKILLLMYGKWSTKNTSVLFYLSSRRGKCFLLPIPGYAADIPIVEEYCQKMLDHRLSLHPY